MIPLGRCGFRTAPIDWNSEGISLKELAKSKELLGRVHYKIACIPEDAHHKTSTDIVRKAAAIGIETLNILGLLKNRNLPRHERTRHSRAF